MSEDGMQDDLRAALEPFAGLPCIKCGECDTITLDLADLDTFTCNSCEATFDKAEVQAVLDVWPHVLAWINLAKSQKEAWKRQLQRLG